jgi:DNA replication protein DnaC
VLSSHAAPDADNMRPIALADLVLPLPNEVGDVDAARTSKSRQCSSCDGTGWYTLRVPYGHPDFSKLFPCACTLEEHERRRRAKLHQISNLASFSDKTFATFDHLVPGIQAAYLHARSFARRPVGWLTLRGPYGCGKTHLAAAIAHEVLAHDVPVLFVVVPDLLDHLRATFRPDSEASYDERFELVRTAALLVLDDVGTESGTAWTREKLYQLVNHRYNERMPTVFTSNVQLDALDGRIVSRMHDTGIGAEIVHIQTHDYRRRQSRPKADFTFGGAEQ